MDPNDQKYDKYDRSFTFESTNVYGKSVVAQLVGIEWGFGKNIYNYLPNKDKLLIKDLKLRNAKVKDFQLLDMTLAELDTKTLSSQYDGLDVVDESEYIGIMNAICKLKKDTLGLTATNNKLTFKTLCNRNDETNENKIEGIKLNQISKINDLKTNKDNLEILNELGINDFKITKLFGISIEDMGLDIDDIDVGKFRVNKLDETYGFLRFAKCTFGDNDGERTDEKETRCACVKQVNPYIEEKMSVGTSEECTESCTQFKGSRLGGACLSTKIIQNLDAKFPAKICQGGSLYEYTSSDGNLGCETGSQCHCYAKETLTTLEKDLLCP